MPETNMGPKSSAQGRCVYGGADSKYQFVNDGSELQDLRLLSHPHHGPMSGE